MIIYDITQELFSCEVYPGDPAPKKETLASIHKGDVCNLTALSVCAHNGTHIDAPYHFFDDGKTVDMLSLIKTVGQAYVAEHNGDVSSTDAENILIKANGISRILIKGDATVTKAAAQVFANAAINLLGNESQTVGPHNAPMEVHKILLAKDIVLLEGIRLAHVPEGEYMLCAQPINLGGCDGAPVRAILIENE
ncbi:MAG: cyclase family protein [Clostridia bacterium]|nr:cyclase family protein [Clostridia bacterium]